MLFILFNRFTRTYKRYYGSVFVFLIFSQFSHIKAEQFWNDKIYQNANFTKLPSAKCFFFCNSKYFHSRIEVLQNCSIFFCLSFLWEKIWVMWEKKRNTKTEPMVLVRSSNFGTKSQTSNFEFYLIFSQKICGLLTFWPTIKQYYSKSEKKNKILAVWKKRLWFRTKVWGFTEKKPLAGKFEIKYNKAAFTVLLNLFLASEYGSFRQSQLFSF